MKAASSEFSHLPKSISRNFVRGIKAASLMGLKGRTASTYISTLEVLEPSYLEVLEKHFILN